MADFTQKPGKTVFDRMAANPAAPSGLKQSAERSGDAWDQYRTGNTQLQPWLPQSMASQATQWYTGQNTQGMNNGWDTQFYNDALKLRDMYTQRAAETGDASVYYKQFEDPNATGVAMWDDPGGKYKLGDIFLNGKKQEGQNLYEVYGQETADLMIGSFYFGGPKNARLFKQKDPGKYSEEIQKYKTDYSDRAKYAQSAQVYQNEIQRHEDSIVQGAGDDLLVAASGLGGAATMAGTGALIGGTLTAWTGPGAIIGTAIGAVGGGVAGLIGGWLNKDELTDLTARAATRQDYLKDQFDGPGELPAWGFALKEWGGIGQRLINPGSNMIRGLYDTTSGGRDDQEVGWYATDEQGQLKRGNLWVAADLVASAADAVGQFSSPLGRALYMGTMGAQVAGGTLGLSTGYGFNESRGQFDKYENFSEWSAGAGSVAIDAVQMGTAGLIGRAARHAREAAGVAGPSITGATGKNWLGGRVAQKMGDNPATRWMQRFDEGTVIGGWRYKLDPATGKVLSRSRTAEAYIPSELARRIPQGLRARQLAHRAGRRVAGDDDYYRAALELSGGNMWRTALVSSYAEAVEEGAQAWLDPRQFGDRAQWQDVLEAAAYGGAGGLGMGLGSLQSRPNPAQQRDAQQRATYALRTGLTELSDRAWEEAKKSMSARDLAMLGVPTPEEDQVFKGIRGMIQDQMQRDRANRPLAAAGFGLTLTDATEESLRGQNSLGGDSTQLLGHQTGYIYHNGQIEQTKTSPGANVESFPETMAKGATWTRAIAAHLESYADAVNQYTSQIATLDRQIADPRTSQEEKDALARQRNDLQVLLDRDTGFVADLSEQMRAVEVLFGSETASGELTNLYQQWARASDPARRSQLIDDFNLRVERLHSGQSVLRGTDGQLIDMEVVRTVLEFLEVRHPLIDTGSYAPLYPQVSKMLSENNGHGISSIHQALLKPLGGDHDGDTLVEAADTYVPPEARRNFRRGHNYLQQEGQLTVADPDDPASEIEVGQRRWVAHIAVPDSEPTYLDLFSSPVNTAEERDLVDQGFERLRKELTDRYVKAGPLSRHAAEFGRILDKFFLDVRSGDLDARLMLVESMWGLDADALFAMSDKNGLPEVLQLWVMITTGWERISENIGVSKFMNETPVDKSTEAARPQDRVRLQRRSRLQAAQLGTSMALVGAQDDPRPSQILHYNPLIQSTVDWTVSRRTETINRQGSSPEQTLAEYYALWGADKTETDREAVDNFNSVEQRVLGWLHTVAEKLAADTVPPVNPKRFYALIASMEAGNFLVDDTHRERNKGDWFGKGDISLLQLMLRRSLQIEENQHRGMAEDSAKAAKIRKLKGLCYPSGAHSSTAAQTLIEVFGILQTADTLGEDSLYLGPQLTFQQHMKLLLSMSPERARQEIRKLRRAPAYFRAKGKQDPPVPVYSVDRLMTRQNPPEGSSGVPELNSYTILVDALQTATSVERDNRKRKATDDAEMFTGGLRRLHDMLDTWHKAHKEELQDQAGKGGVTREQVFRHMLAQREDIARLIATLVPKASREFVFQLIDGNPTSEKFLESVMLDRSVERAAAKFWLFTKLAEWGALQSMPNSLELLGHFDEKTGKWVQPESVSEVSRDEILGVVDPRNIKSRFLETIYYLATLQDGGHELRRFLTTVFQADNLTDLFKSINSEATWLYGRADLQPFNDSVEDYQFSADDVYNSGNTDQDVRLALRAFASQIDIQARLLVEQRHIEDANEGFINLMWNENQRQKNPSANRHRDSTAETLLAQLDTVQQHRRYFGDTIGPRAREQMMEAFHEMIFRIHDKGKPPEELRPLGEVLATVDKIGFGSAFTLEINALHAYDWRSVMDNPTALVDGPVRIQLRDGSTLVVDLSTRDGILDALKERATRSFAMAVIGSTTRDLNDENVAQLYQDSNYARGRGRPGRLDAMLHEAATMVSVFDTSDTDQISQDWRLIGLVEAFLRKATLDQLKTARANNTGSQDDFEAEAMKIANEGYYPLNRMMNEILEAYQTTAGTGRTQAQAKALRNELVHHVAEALKMMGEVDISMLPRVKEAVIAFMRERMRGETNGIQRLLDSIADEDQREVVMQEQRMACSQMLSADVQQAFEAWQQATAQGQSQEILDGFKQAWLMANSRLADFNSTGNFDLIEGVATIDFSAVQRMFALTHAPQDVDTDTLRKGAIIAYLAEGGRINRYNVGKLGPLTEKLLTMAHMPNNGLDNIKDWDPLTPEQWDQLVLWSTSSFMSERAMRSSTEIKGLPITSKNTAELARLHDDSWVSLLDRLFDEKTVRAMKYIVDSGGNNRGFDPQTEMLSAEEIARRLTTTLLNEKLIGPWNDRVPMNILKADLAIRQARAAATLPEGGNTPKDQGALVGITQVSFRLPEPEHFSATSVQIGPGEGAASGFGPDALVKLHHHFVKSVELVPTRTQTPFDVLSEAAGVDRQNTETENSGLRLLDMHALYRTADRLAQSNPEFDLGYSIEITYVDVDKMPGDVEVRPDGSTISWANNRFFDGRGRDAEGRAETSLISSLYFGLGGVSKLLQQFPLDALSKSGGGPAPFLNATYSQVEQLEKGSVAEILRKKAWHLLTRHYPIIQLSLDDLTTMYKIVRLRHVIVGRNTDTGKKEVWWPQKYIEMQARGKTIPLEHMDNPGQPPELVALSDNDADILHGGSGFDPTDPQRPLVNVQDLPQLPSLSEQRLKSLGMERLGEKAELKEAPVAQFTALPRARDYAGPSRTGRTARELDLDAAVRRANKIQQLRMQQMNKGTGWTVQKISKAARQFMFDTLAAEEKLQGPLTSLGMIPQGTTDSMELDASQRELSTLMDTLGPTNVVWLFDIEAGEGTNDVPLGVLGRVGLDSFYGDESAESPAYGDHVAIDLESILRYNGYDEVKAQKQTLEVVTAFARRGVRIMLGSTNGNTSIRRIASEFLTQGPSPVRYQRVQGVSGHFFEPVFRDLDIDATREMYDADLGAMDHEATKNINLNILIDAPGLNEGIREVTPRFFEVNRKVELLLVPTQLTLQVSSHNVLAFGPPVLDTVDQQDSFSMIADNIVRYGRTPEGEAELLRRMGSFPEGTPIFRELSDDRFQPGVRSKKQALKKFLDTLEAGKNPLDPGEQVMAGDLCVLVSQDGSLFIHRIGFELPKASDRRELLEQWDSPLGEEGGLRLAFGPAKPRQAVKQPPPIIIDEIMADHRGVMLLGKYELSYYTKMLGHGEKTGTVDMPEGLTIASGMSIFNDSAIGSRTGKPGTYGKAATRGLVTNFRNLFAFAGADFRRDLVERLTIDDGRSFEERWDRLLAHLNRFARTHNDLTPTEALKLLSNQQEVNEKLLEWNLEGRTKYGSAWQDLWPVNPNTSQLNDPSTLLTDEDRLIQIILVTLAVSGMEPSQIVTVPGLATTRNPLTSDAVVGFIPEEMSKALDNPLYPGLRKKLIDRANAVLPKYVDEDGIEHNGNWFSYDFHLNVTMRQETDRAKPTYKIEPAYLQLETPLAADENAVNRAFNVTYTRDTSLHLARTTAGQGGYTVTKGQKKDKEGRVIPTMLDRLYGDHTYMDFESNEDVVWDFFTRVAPRVGEYYPAKYLMPLEHARWLASDEKVGQYTQTIPRDPEEWPNNGEASRLLEDLGLDPTEIYEVDYLVRQWLGAPAPKQGSDEIETINHKAYVEAVAAMRRQIKKGMHPLLSGDVPMPHHNFWHKVFLAQQHRSNPWLPVAGVDEKGVERRVDVNDWGQWVDVLMSQMRTSTAPFHKMFQLDLDGFYHTYQGTTPSYSTTPISLEQELIAKLIDPENHRNLLSVDPGINAITSDPILLETMEATWRAMSGHDPVFSPETAEDTQASSRAYRNAQRKKWEEGNLPNQPKSVPMMDHVKTGAEYQAALRSTNAFLRGAVHLSIITRLANPGLYVSAPIEVFMRSRLEDTVSLLLGESSGPAGKGISALADYLGLQDIKPRYTTDQIKKLDKLAEQLGGRGNPLPAALFGEMTYQNMILPTGELDEEGNVVNVGGRVGNWLERTAAKVARVVNDPTYGQRQTTAMRRYLYAAYEYLEATGNYVPLETFIQMFEADPLWLKKQFPKNDFSPHKAGANAVAQVRSTKGTLLGNAIMWPIDKLYGSDKTGRMFLGAGLKVPFMFTRFNVNAFLTLTGFRTIDQMLAASLHGRRTTGSWVKEWMATRKKEAPPPAEYRDLSDVVEAFDLERAIIRGGVTQTGLFVMGMIGSQMLGLGGEDEEERRRRRMERYLNLPHFYDPRKAEDAFEYADAIWLDSVPILGGMFSRDFGGELKSPVVPHWILRQFTSPLMGVIRFFDSGDLAEIRNGFWDAASVIPHSALNVWRETQETAELITSDIAQLELQGVDSDEANIRKLWMLSSIVGVYERALFENQFLNALYTAKDDVDRNPYAVQKTDESNNIVFENGYPVQTEALQPYLPEQLVDPVTGEPLIDPDTGAPIDPDVRLRYEKRTGMDAILHQYAENNGTAAIVMSLFTGQSDSTYLRGNMVPREQNVPLELPTKAQAEALLLASFFGTGDREIFTKEEIIQGIKYQINAAGGRWQQHEVEALADIKYKELNQSEFALSILDEDAREILTKAGAESVYTGLLKGSVTFDSPALRGIYIPETMRDEIAREWLQENVQESIDLGMSSESAEYRKRRFWYGDRTQGIIGLKELIYSDKISTIPVAKYRQLNVTFTIGPNGLPWATPFTRGTLLGAFGLPVPHSVELPVEGTSLDSRGNVVNELTGTNTGLKAVVPGYVVSEIDYKAKDKILDEADPKKTTPGWTNRTSRYFGRYGGYRRSYGGYRRGGYSSRSSGGGYVTPLFTDKVLRAIRGGYGPDMQGTYAPNFDNPIIRRADVRRERVSSERGRLKQWQ